MDGERRSYARQALHGDMTAQRLGQMLDDGKPEPRSTDVARPSPIDAVKALEEARQMAGRDAGTGVSDRDANLALSFGGRERDLGAARSILDGVVDEVRENLLERASI